MTLQANGQISASDINIELGRAGTATFDIDGAEERALAGVPSGAISLSDFYGKSAASVQLPGGSVQDLTASPGTATATLTFESDGEISWSGFTVPSPLLDWWTQAPTAGIGSSYEVRATLSSGVAPSLGTLGTWLTLSSNRFWENVQSSIGARSSTLLIEIRPTGGAVAASGSYTITATVEV